MPPHAYDAQRALEVESLTLPELVCFENTDFCVVNKPFDLQIDGARPATLELLLKKLHPDFRELRFCHQLDYATSGLLLLAKSRSAAAAARAAFDGRMVVKRYQALVEGVFDGPTVVREPILEREDGCVEISAEGKSAETQFELSEIGEFMGQAVSQIRVSPVTGRRHQIRVHLLHLGHRIVGDMRYGGSEHAPRMMLHASALSIPHIGLPLVEREASFPALNAHSMNNA